MVAILTIRYPLGSRGTSETQWGLSLKSPQFLSNRWGPPQTEERIALQDALIRRMERNGEDVLAEIGRNLLEDLRQSLREARDHVERLKDLQH